MKYKFKNLNWISLLVIVQLVVFLLLSLPPLLRGVCVKYNRFGDYFCMEHRRIGHIFAEAGDKFGYILYLSSLFFILVALVLATIGIGRLIRNNYRKWTNTKRFIYLVIFTIINYLFLFSSLVASGHQPVGCFEGGCQASSLLPNVFRNFEVLKLILIYLNPFQIIVPFLIPPILIMLFINYKK